MQMEPLRFFISQNDPAPFNGATFSQSVEKKRKEVVDIAGQLEVISASLFSYSAASDKIDEAHRNWAKELTPLRAQLVGCKKATNSLYEQLPNLEPSSCIPEATQNIQWLSQQIRFTKTRLKNLLSTLQSPTYTEAVKIYKTITKSYEEFSEREDDPNKRLTKLNALFDSWITAIQEQQQAIRDLKSAFLISRVNSLHIEFVNFFRQTKSSISSSLPDTLARKIEQLKICDDFKPDNDESIPEDFLQDLTENEFDIIDYALAAEPSPPPKIEIDYTAICKEITHLISRFGKEELRPEFRFKNSDGLLQSCYRLVVHSNMETQLKESEEVAKVLQGLQNELQHRISLICKGLPCLQTNCTSLPMESSLYQEILSLQYKKLCTVRKKLYDQGLQEGVRSGLYYISRLFAAYHDTKELHLFFSKLIEEKTLSVFSAEKIVFTCIDTPAGSPAYFPNLCSSAQAVIDVHDIHYSNDHTKKFITQIVGSLKETVAQLGRKSFEARADFQPFWKTISENGSLDSFREYREPEIELPESLKTFLIKEMARQLHFTREPFIELDLILFGLHYNQKYRGLLEASLKSLNFSQIYNSYKKQRLDEPTLERLYLIFANLNRSNKLGSFENYINYLRSSVLIESSNKLKNPLIEKFLEKAKQEHLATQIANNFPAFTPIKLSTLSLNSEHISQKGFLDHLQTVLATAYWGENQIQATIILKEFLASFSKTSPSMPPAGHLSLLLGVFVCSLQLKEPSQRRFSSDFEEAVFNEMYQGYIKIPAISLALRHFFGIPACELLLYSHLTDNLSTTLQQYRGIVGFKIWNSIVEQYRDNSITSINPEPFKKGTLGYYRTEILAIVEAIETNLSHK